MNLPRQHYDAVIIGAGMAGASLGAELAAHMSVLLVEMEAQPGYHATGRSVAFWSESYGGPLVRPLTKASLPMLATPAPDFAEEGFLAPRGALHIGRAGDEAARAALIDDFSGKPLFAPVDAAELQRRITGLRPQWIFGLEEPGTRDIDVAALHTAYLRAFARRGGHVSGGTRFEGAVRTGAGEWRVRLANGEVIASRLINAAGAWADDVARSSGIAPLGITPLLRTVVQLRVDPPASENLPLVLDLAGGFYFKPVGGGRIWLTPHDEQPMTASDVAADEMDVAIAIERLREVVDWRIEAMERKWAGLRSFAPDRLPVYGFDPDEPGFFWFAGQGGFGIQTAPAAALLAKALILEEEMEAALADIDPTTYAPARLR